MFNLFKKDPAKDWEKSNIRELILDLSYGSLNHIQFGDSPEKLSYFGKPDNKNPFEKKIFLYSAIGLIVGIENEIISYLTITMVDNPFEKLKAGSFHLKDFKGELHIINGSTAIDTIEQILGKPDEVHKHNDGADLTFYRSKYQIEIEFDNEEKVVCFDIMLKEGN